MSLSFEERKDKILDFLEKNGTVKVHDLSEYFNVSTETIRRDLERLEKENKLKKVYGGAVKTRMDAWEPPFVQRTQHFKAEKESIGQLAASLVKDGETIMLGNGTTTLEVIRNLNRHKNVTIVTHSTPHMLLAMESFEGRIIFIGGEVNVEQQSVTGPLAEMMLQHLKVNKAFISAGGISLQDGITEYDLNEANISRKMMDRAEEVIVLADHSKFGKTTFANISSLQDIYMIITDDGCPKEWRQILAERDIDVHIAT